MSLEPGRYRFNGSQLLPLEIDSALALYVADSWLTIDGATVALDRHFARFAASADAQGLVRPVDEFLAAARAAIPSTGAWFPRLELTVRGELQLWLRVAPERTREVILWNAPEDTRTEPTIKGPDIPALEDMRANAREAGASEAVITTADGFIVDGSTTCLLWWRDGALHVPPAEFARVTSVTVSVLRDIAQAHGVNVVEERATVADLEDLEVWAVNSLHGIRPATSWQDGPALSISAERLASWRAWYEAARQS